MFSKVFIIIHPTFDTALSSFSKKFLLFHVYLTLLFFLPNMQAPYIFFYHNSCPTFFLLSNIHAGNIVLENFLGDAFLTDFTHSKDRSSTVMTCEKRRNDSHGTSDRREVCDSFNGTEGDFDAVGILLTQLLLGQSDRNHW